MSAVAVEKYRAKTMAHAIRQTLNARRAQNWRNTKLKKIGNDVARDDDGDAQDFDVGK